MNYNIPCYVIRNQQDLPLAEIVDCPDPETGKLRKDWIYIGRGQPLTGDDKILLDSIVNSEEVTRLACIIYSGAEAGRNQEKRRIQ